MCIRDSQPPFRDYKVDTSAQTIDGVPSAPDRGTRLKQTHTARLLSSTSSTHCGTAGRLNYYLVLGYNRRTSNAAQSWLSVNVCGTCLCVELDYVLILPKQPWKLPFSSWICKLCLRVYYDNSKNKTGPICFLPLSEGRDTQSGVPARLDDSTESGSSQGRSRDLCCAKLYPINVGVRIPRPLRPRTVFQTLLLTERAQTNRCVLSATPR